MNRFNQREVQINEWFQEKFHHPKLNVIGSFFHHAFLERNIIIAGLILFCINYYQNDILVCTQIVGLGHFILITLKLILNRFRPVWLPISDAPKLKSFVKDIQNDSSFPSGHTAFVFTIFTVAMYLEFFPSFKYTWLAVAIITTIERIRLGAHYPSDCLIGAIYGTLFPVILFESGFVDDYLLTDFTDINKRSAMALIVLLCQVFILTIVLLLKQNNLLKNEFTKEEMIMASNNNYDRMVHTVREPTNHSMEANASKSTRSLRNLTKTISRRMSSTRFPRSMRNISQTWSERDLENYYFNRFNLSHLMPFIAMTAFSFNIQAILFELDLLYYYPEISLTSRLMVIMMVLATVVFFVLPIKYILSQIQRSNIIMYNIGFFFMYYIFLMGCSILGHFILKEMNE